MLSKTRNSFDPLTSLCNNDLELVEFDEQGLKRSLMRIHLKSPKEKRIGTGTKLEIFGNDTFCCPVRAWKKWRKVANLSGTGPIFMEGSVCYTGKDFNKLLTHLTKPITDGTDGVIRPHSFGSGVASEMGVRGFSDSDIQAQGRWSSQAFKAYMK